MSVKTLHDRRQPGERAARTRRSSTSRDEHGIQIPRLCHLEGLGESAPAGCAWSRSRASTSSAGLPDAGRGGHGRRAPTPSGCRATASMIVELLFAERNHVCAVCVVNGDCELQELGYAVGIDHVRFAYQIPALRVDASHERFALDHNRCVLCTRCVRVCDEVEGAHTWDVRGRGAKRQVITDLEPALGRVRDAAPAAASASRSARPARCSRRARRRPRWQEPRLPHLPRDRAGEEAMDPMKPKAPRLAHATLARRLLRAATCRSSTWTSG